jgi:F-type H+-transporting ATPase subunit alpha
MPVEKQIAIIFCGTRGLLSKVPVGKVREFETEYLDFLELKHKDVLATLKKGILTSKEEDLLDKVAMELAAKYAVKK